MKKILILLYIALFAGIPAFAEEKETPQNTAENTFSKEAVVNKKTFRISSVDTPKGINAQNALVIYTKLFGKTTNTDSKGFEAVVVNNRVIKLNQNNSYIPENGYVVSGRGEAKKFIVDNLFEGADVQIDFDKGEFVVLTHPDNYLYEASYRLEKMKKMYANSDKEKVDEEQMEFYIERAEDLLNTTKKLIAFNDFENAQRMAQDSMTYSDMALFFSLLYDEEEFRGIKVFPYQKNEEEVKQAFDAINSLGIENIFIEGYYNGLTIYKSEVQEKYNLPAQNRYYGDFDPLKAWIDLAKESEKNIYVSINVFELGKIPKSSIKTSIVSIYPEWVYKNSNQEYFLKPNMAETQRYLLALIDEITKKYEISGINLTGLNVPDSNQEVKEFVNKILAYGHTNEKIKIAIDVTPFSTDIKKWNLDENVILCPVLASSDIEYTEKVLNDIKEKTNNALVSPIYTEPFNEEKPRYFFDQLTKSRELGVKGVIISNFDYLTKEYSDALKYSVFNSPNKETQEDENLIQLNMNPENQEQTEEQSKEQKEEVKNGTEL